MCCFAENSSDSELQAINTDFTFELFICASILLDNREPLLQCRDDVQLIQFTSRLVNAAGYRGLIARGGEFGWMCQLNLGLFLFSLQGTLDLNSTLKKAEHLLYNYCKRRAWDYMNGHCREPRSRGEDFLYQLRSLLVLKWLLLLKNLTSADQLIFKWTFLDERCFIVVCQLVCWCWAAHFESN